MRRDLVALVFVVIIGALAAGCTPSSSPPTGFPDTGGPEVLDAAADRGGMDHGPGADSAAPELRGGDADAVDVLPDLWECAAGHAISGCPCNSNPDCASGWCVFHRGEQVCADVCETECPAGFTCKNVGGVDPVLICVSRFPSLCLPCMETEGCEGTDLCFVHDPAAGSFCSPTCGNGAPCPAGYSCLARVTVEGADGHACIPDAGECACSGYAAAQVLGTACAQSNGLGTCEGWRECSPAGLSPCSAPVPALESCNGADDDCDGVADDGALCDDGSSCTLDACEAGACQHAPLDGEGCFDADLCTYDDHCVAGACVGQPVTCNDFNPCTDDGCDPDAGCTFQDNTLPCASDGNPCTLDACAGGTCAHKAVPDGTPCQDTLPCTLEELCQGGTCLPTMYDSTCPLTCGDGICTFPDNANDCPVDCGPCGDGVCGFWEQKAETFCTKDCATACGNGDCEEGEDPASCPVDCGPCGDGVCGFNDFALGCAGQDCAPACGDGACVNPESPVSCPVDCGKPCGDQVCTAGETAAGCPEDCGTCGDGWCSHAELEVAPEKVCGPDCVVPCGDGQCAGGETPEGCPYDCGPCGDGVCGHVEMGLAICPQDCPIGCGNGLCDEDEDDLICPADCGCLPVCAPSWECGLDATGCDEPCGACWWGPQWACVDHLCVCTPQCAGKICGPDGCGGVCGQCPCGNECTDGACVFTACDGKACGPDGCGGGCGECAQGSFCFQGACYAQGVCFQHGDCAFLLEWYPCLGLQGACDLETHQCRDPQVEPEAFTVEDGCFLEVRTQIDIPAEFACVAPGETLALPAGSGLTCLVCDPAHPHVWSPSQSGAGACFIDLAGNPVSAGPDDVPDPEAFPWATGACVDAADPTLTPDAWPHPVGNSSWECLTCDPGSGFFGWSPTPDGTWSGDEVNPCEFPVFTVPTSGGGLVDVMSPAYAGTPYGRCVAGVCRGLALDPWLPVGFGGAGHVSEITLDQDTLYLAGSLGTGFGTAISP